VRHPQRAGATEGLLQFDVGIRTIRQHPEDLRDRGGGALLRVGHVADHRGVGLLARQHPRRPEDEARCHLPQHPGGVAGIGAAVVQPAVGGDPDQRRLGKVGAPGVEGDRDLVHDGFARGLVAHHETRDDDVVDGCEPLLLHAGDPRGEVLRGVPALQWHPGLEEGRDGVPHRVTTSQ